MSDSAATPVNTGIDDCPVLQTNIRWPTPVDQLLNELVHRFVTESAGDITRSRLLAAIVAHAPRDGSGLAELVQHYGTLTAGDVVDQPTGFLENPIRRPGRQKLRGRRRL